MGRCIICLKNNDNNQNNVTHIEIVFLVVFFFTETYYFVYIHTPLLWRSRAVAALLEKYVSTFFLGTSKEQFIGGFHAKLVQA